MKENGDLPRSWPKPVVPSISSETPAPTPLQGTSSALPVAESYPEKDSLVHPSDVSVNGADTLADTPGLETSVDEWRALVVAENFAKAMPLLTSTTPKWASRYRAYESLRRLEDNEAVRPASATIFVGGVAYAEGGQAGYSARSISIVSGLGVARVRTCLSAAVKYQNVFRSSERFLKSGGRCFLYKLSPRGRRWLIEYRDRWKEDHA